MHMKTVFRLTKAITVAGTEMKEITLREPSTADIRKLGQPFVFDAEGQIVMATNTLAKYLVRLSNLADGDVDKLDIADFNEITLEIFNFLGGQMTVPQVTESAN